jgi:hypothetical protein
MYTAIVLDQPSQQLLSTLFSILPTDWERHCHHMTINLGPASNGPAQDLLGHVVDLKAVSVSANDRVAAVSVETDVPSVNSIKHVTLGVNRGIGAKPVESNRLNAWNPLHPPLQLRGTVAEVH